MRKLRCRLALDINQTALAAAHVDQQPDRQRHIGFESEILDLLQLAVFGKNEIVFDQVIDQGSVVSRTVASILTRQRKAAEDISPTIQIDVNRGQHKEHHH
ncbi:MAG: hypothetical protein DMG57_10160 [Acidobacteria bacterium]|nr:MAG: hypothetical protein DMG57_10160 [Acidobacteriota bacterium]